MSSKKLAKVSLSDSTTKTRIDDLAKDIEFQVLEKVRASPFFAIQCDETTDVANLSQLMVYVRFVGSTSFEEEMLFCRPLETGCKAADVFEAVASYFNCNNLKWENLVGVCTDGAPAMLGSRGGFITLMKQRSPNIIGSHCVIHREALASRTLPVVLNEILAITIRVVNYVKASALNSRLFTMLCKEMDSNHEMLLFHTSVRWLSKGNMLARVYEMREEVKVFLEDQRKQDLLSFTSDSFQLALAYLVDIFEALNVLNRLLQGKNSNRMDHYDSIHSFIAKLGLWLRRVRKGNTASFHHLDADLEKKKINLEGVLKAGIEEHLRLLIQEFEQYFPDLEKTELPEWRMTRNPFNLNEDILCDDLQEEFF